MNNTILSIQNLTVTLRDSPSTAILQDVSFAVPKGAIVGLVGGSGSGKTTIGMATLGLLPAAMRIAGGNILFDGRDLTELAEPELREVRGKSIGFVFQEPVSAFDPLFTVGSQIAETIQAHETVPAEALQSRIIRLLSTVGLPDPVRAMKSYPHELSGGLRQRAMIAQAIACGPSLLIADEPTSSLDVTLQAHIMELFRQLRKDLGLSVLLISHDLGMVRNLADEVVILERGRVVEQGPVARIMAVPRHEYAKKLIEAETL
jgi:ABC-type glutathione transport system ATPase component